MAAPTQPVYVRNTYRSATPAEKFRGRAAIAALRAELAVKPRSMFAQKVSDDLAEARNGKQDRPARSLPKAS